MATIEENLQRLVNAKTAIANAITAKGGTVNEGDGFEEFPSDIASITNTYTASDEGKVVSNGALVAQGSDTVTQNGTVDTTLISSLLVNVGNVCDKLTTDNQSVSTSDIYICDFGMYIYLFGYVEMTAGANCVFTAYNFAMSRINATYQAMYANRSTGATTSIGTPTINTLNNTIKFYCPKGRYDYYYAFTKKAQA